MSVLLAGFLARTVNPGELWAVLAAGDYRFLVPAVALYFGGVGLRAGRWGFVLRPVAWAPFRRLYPLVVVSQAGNNLLPARLGQLLRLYYLKKREGAAPAAVLGGLGVERVYDGLATLALGLAGLAGLYALGELGGLQFWHKQVLFFGALGLALLFLAGLAVVVWLTVRPEGVRVFYPLVVGLSAGLAAKAGDFLDTFVSGLGGLSRPRQHLELLAWSVLVWLGEATVYFTVALSFGLGDWFGGWVALVCAVMLVTAVSNLAGAFPLSVGGIGPFELAAQVALSAFGVPPETALSYALAVHLLALWLPVNVVGVALLIKWGAWDGLQRRWRMGRMAQS